MDRIQQIFASGNLLPYLLAIAVVVMIVLIWRGLIEDRSAERRIKMLEARRQDLRNQTLQPGARRAEQIDFMRKIVDRLNLAKGEASGKINILLAQAGYRNKDAFFVYVFVRGFAPLVGFLVGFLLFYVLRIWDTTNDQLAFATFATGVLFFYAPNMYLKNVKQKRMTALLKALPDGLDLFVICAEAGLSLDATFDRVATEIADAHPGLADEFGLTSIELGFMPDRNKALQNLSMRCDMPGIRSLVSTLIQTERYGTPLAVSMRVLSGEMRNERMMKAEEKAARLPAIMTVPMIIFILPPLFVVLIGPAILKAMDSFK